MSCAQQADVAGERDKSVDERPEDACQRRQEWRRQSAGQDEGQLALTAEDNEEAFGLGRRDAATEDEFEDGAMAGRHTGS
ncbi:MAG: hypothetical protein WCE75_10660 [Terracidiphilus sp.]